MDWTRVQRVGLRPQSLFDPAPGDGGMIDDLDEFYELVCAGNDAPECVQRCSQCSLVVSDRGRKCETCAHRVRLCDCGAYKGRTDLPPQFQDCMGDCPRVKPERSVRKHTRDQVRATIERIKRRAAGKTATIRRLY